MLDHNELCRWFTKSQQQDMIDLDISCMQTPPGRIRRARIRKVKPNHIPRPVNSFMSYRTEKQSIIRKFCPTANHRDISKMVAKWWHNVGSQEKDIYVEKAKAAKDAHNEQYPDYIFRPKAKRTKKSVVKNADPLSQEQDDYYGDSSARTRPITAVRSHLRQHNVNGDPFPSTSINNDIPFNITFDNDCIYNCNSMFNDEVLFQAKEDVASTSDFWGAYQSNEQVTSDSFPGLIDTHDSNFRLDYYPSPHDSAVSPNIFALNTQMNSIDPLVTTMPNINNSFNYNNPYDLTSFTNNTNCGGYFNNDGQLFSQFDCEVTPQSQAMSTPRLNYPNSPSSPYVNVSNFYDQGNMKHQQQSDQMFAYQNDAMFDTSLPTDVLSPSMISNADFVSWPNNSNIKYESGSGDCEFWRSSVI